MIRTARWALALALLGSAPVRAQPERSGAAPPPPPSQPLAQGTQPREVPGVSWSASGSNGAVAAGGAEAVAAGMEILKSGGNATDAGIATVLALSVTDASLFCFGGEVPILISDAKSGARVCISGQGAAPKLATPEHFEARGGIPKIGPESATVPAVVGAATAALRGYGTMSFAQVAAPTLRILGRTEQPWHSDLARTIRTLIAAEANAGTDRLKGLENVDDEFYRGSVARALDAWAQANGALLRHDDLAAHRTHVESPIAATYRGYTVLKPGTWTQGPCLLEALQLLEGFDLKAAGASSPDAIHLCTEALKLALADRDEYYGDPLFESVPLEALLSPQYVALRRPLIDPEHASLVLRPGDPEAKRAVKEATRSRPDPSPGTPNDTTTCVVADKDGNVFAATPSGWDGVLAGPTGIWLGSRMQSFNLWEGHPNRLAPGKRPRITLTPAIVLNKDGVPVLAVSVAGGDLQDQVVLQMIVDSLDFGMSPAEAVKAPRFSTSHHVGSFGQAPPKLGHLELNDRIPIETREALKKLGHRIVSTPGAIANPVLLRRDPETGRIEAAGDPQARRHAAAF
jgi:gamma-glutamyltranspeptidase/glutathione hydrolase